MHRIRLVTLSTVTLAALAACAGTDLERGALGAAGGAAVASLTGSDVVGGALIGGAAGVFCDDAGVCADR